MPDRAPKTPAAVLGGLVLALVVAPGCAKNRAGAPGPGNKVLETNVFAHEVHIVPEASGGPGLRCEQCHAVDPAANYRTKRPGLDQHSPCDTCHEEAFYEAPGEICMTCHVSVDPLREEASPLSEYPSRRRRASLVSAFNHKKHLTLEQDEALACESCHSAEAALATFPTHGNCTKCHAGTDNRIQLDNCEACHEHDGPGRARKFVCNDVRFTHAKHRVDPGGAPIECVRCHVYVPQSSRTGDLNLPTMAQCEQCHDTAIVDPQRRIENCGLCHQDDVSSRPLPSNHTGETEAARQRVRHGCP